ncbi:acyl carrier protein [Paracraurococcus lichenis]|uniref:Acyl carrier protein n=1 Tax=Paracraurococcus lichenis TaxID=3064888 RepID=A0ABT9E7G7_9PROT|nr:acyl carrier protein [Paracraurococcus sp. LOR1-02]MDO9712079.1 acyl carrier protein [Paracraurococcus sp. LOR1-02]
MTEEEALARLTEVFRAVFRRPGLVLDPAWTAADLDGWDSLRHVELVLATEARFDVRLEAEALAGLGSVGDLLAAVRAAGSRER